MVAQKKHRRAKPPARTRDGRLKGGLKLPLLAVLAFLLYFGVATAGPVPVGLWQDDAIYLSTAQSLAEGTGYRHIEIATQPLQTKYPILYSAVLTPLMALSGYPRNLTLLLMPSALAAAAMAVLWVVYLRRSLDAPRRWALAVGIVSALSPAILSLARFTMSDLLYGGISIAALVALDVNYTASTTARARLRWLIISAVLMGLAALTRSFGLTLVAAGALTLLSRRRFRHVALMGSIVLLSLLPWWVWQASAARINGPLQHSTLEAPELSYSLWLPRSISQVGRVIWQNIFRTVFDVAYYQIALPPQFCQTAIAAFSWRTLMLHVLCWGAALLITIGFVASCTHRPWREQSRTSTHSEPHDITQSRLSRWQTVHLYTLLYGALMLVWPFDPGRFLVVWTPFVLYCLVVGVRASLLFACRRFALDARRGLAIAPVSLLAVLALLFVADDVRIATSTADNYYMRETTVDLAEVQHLERWVLANTSLQDIIASDRPGGLFLATGRRGQYYWPDSNPYSLYYGKDRSAWRFYVWPGDQEIQQVYEEMRGLLARSYVAGRIRYCVEHTDANAQATALGRFIAENSSWFQLQYTSPKGTYSVYRLAIRSPSD
jgi:hypothetical protein